MTFKEKFPRFTTWIIKWHINYLLSAILLYGFKAAIYFLIAKVTAAINAPYVMFNMEIDRLIPFIPEFYIFSPLYRRQGNICNLQDIFHCILLICL